jgi:DNA-binding transcriptional regulator GbsR (MarR family)
MGELVSFWGFKASMGRIWTILYMSRRALTADEIAQRTNLSTGAVSMALSELMKWGIATRQPTPQARKRHYKAEIDVWAIVRRIMRERELRLIERAVDNFSEALSLLEDLAEQDASDQDTVYAIQRLRGLLELAHIGYRLVEKLADVGQFSLTPIRGALKRIGLGR